MEYRYIAMATLTYVMPTPRATTPSIDPVGRYLRELRLKRNLTQEALANEVGMSQIVISELERGIQNFETVGFARVMNLLKALNITLVDLVENTGLDLNGSIVWQFEKAGVVYDAINAAKDYKPYIEALEDAPITPESKARGKLLEKARLRANMDPIQAQKASGVNAIIIRALEHGHDITGRLSIDDARALHKAYGLSAAEFSSIMDLQIIVPSSLPRSLQAVAKAFLESGDEPS